MADEFLEFLIISTLDVILRDNLALQLTELVLVDGDARCLIILEVLLLIRRLLTMLVGPFLLTLLVFIWSRSIRVTLREEVGSWS